MTTEHTTSYFCPEEVSLDAATYAIGEHGAQLGTGDQSLAAINITRSCLKQVRDRLECQGPALNQQRQLVCPFATMVQSAVSRAVTAPPSLMGPEATRNDSGSPDDNASYL